MCLWNFETARLNRLLSEMDVSVDAVQIVIMVLAEIEIRQCLLGVESIIAMLPTW